MSAAGDTTSSSIQPLTYTEAEIGQVARDVKYSLTAKTVGNYCKSGVLNTLRFCFAVFKYFLKSIFFPWSTYTQSHADWLGKYLFLPVRVLVRWPLEYLIFKTVKFVAIKVLLPLIGLLWHAVLRPIILPIPNLDNPNLFQKINRYNPLRLVFYLVIQPIFYSHQAFDKNFLGKLNLFNPLRIIRYALIKPFTHSWQSLSNNEKIANVLNPVRWVRWAIEYAILKPFFTNISEAEEIELPKVEKKPLAVTNSTTSEVSSDSSFETSTASSVDSVTPEKTTFFFKMLVGVPARLVKWPIEYLLAKPIKMSFEEQQETWRELKDSQDSVLALMAILGQFLLGLPINAIKFYLYQVLFHHFDYACLTQAEKAAQRSSFFKKIAAGICFLGGGFVFFAFSCAVKKYLGSTAEQLPYHFRDWWRPIKIKVLTCVFTLGKALPSIGLYIFTALSWGAGLIIKVVAGFLGLVNGIVCLKTRVAALKNSFEKKLDLDEEQRKARQAKQQAEDKARTPAQKMARRATLLFAILGALTAGLTGFLGTATFLSFMGVEEYLPILLFGAVSAMVTYLAFQAPDTPDNAEKKFYELFASTKNSNQKKVVAALLTVFLTACFAYLFDFQLGGALSHLFSSYSEVGSLFAGVNLQLLTAVLATPTIAIMLFSQVYDAVEKGTDPNKSIKDFLAELKRTDDDDTWHAVLNPTIIALDAGVYGATSAAGALKNNADHMLLALLLAGSCGTATTGLSWAFTGNKVGKRSNEIASESKQAELFKYLAKERGLIIYDHKTHRYYHYDDTKYKWFDPTRYRSRYRAERLRHLNNEQMQALYAKQNQPLQRYFIFKKEDFNSDSIANPAIRIFENKKCEAAIYMAIFPHAPVPAAKQKETIASQPATPKKSSREILSQLINPPTNARDATQTTVNDFSSLRQHFVLTPAGYWDAVCSQLLQLRRNDFPSNEQGYANFHQEIEQEMLQFRSGLIDRDATLNAEQKQQAKAKIPQELAQLSATDKINFAMIEMKDILKNGDQWQVLKALVYFNAQNQSEFVEKLMQETNLTTTLAFIAKQPINKINSGDHRLFGYNPQREQRFTPQYLKELTNAVSKELNGKDLYQISGMDYVRNVCSLQPSFTAAACA